MKSLLLTISFSLLVNQSVHAYAQKQAVIAIHKGTFQTDINATPYIADALVCGNYPSISINVVGQIKNKVLISVKTVSNACFRDEEPKHMTFDISYLEPLLESMNIDPQSADIFFNMN